MRRTPTGHALRRSRWFTRSLRTLRRDALRLPIRYAQVAAGIAGRGYVAAIVATGIAGVRGLLILPIVTKGLSVTDYGLWVQFGVGSTLLSMLALSGVEGTTIRFLSGSRDRGKDAAFSAAALATMAIGALAALASFATAVLVDELRLKTALFSAGILVIGLIAERLAVTQLRRLLAMKSYAVAAIAFAGGDVAAIGGALALGLGLAGAIGAWGLVKCIAALAVLVYSHLAYSAVVAPRADRLWELGRFALPLAVVAMLIWVLNLFDRFLVGWLVGLEAVALYSASYAVAGMVAFAFAPVFLIVQPVASGLWQEGERERAIQTLERGLEKAVWSAAPAVVVLMVWGSEILAWLTRPEYRVAAASAVIVAAGMFIQQVGGFAEIALGLKRHSRIYMPIYGGAAAANVIVNVILLPLIGFEAAAIATLIGAVVYVALIYLAIGDTLDWLRHVWRVTPPVAAGGAVAVSLLAVRESWPEMWFPAAVVLLVAYTSAAIAFVRRDLSSPVMTS